MDEVEKLKQRIRQLEAELDAMTERARINGLRGMELQAEIENAPVVYQRNSEPYTGKEFETGVWTEHKRAADTHRARLVRIEKLEGK